MFEPFALSGCRKTDDLSFLTALESLVCRSCSFAGSVGMMANASALLKWYLGDSANWVGFYLIENGELVLGPFQGLPACERIAMGTGVCGTAAAGKRSIAVPDVLVFPGHIACSSVSRSEIVCPLIKDGMVFGVLDADSPDCGFFTEKDIPFFESASLIVSSAFCF